MTGSVLLTSKSHLHFTLAGDIFRPIAYIFFLVILEIMRAIHLVRYAIGTGNEPIAVVGIFVISIWFFCTVN